MSLAASHQSPDAEDPGLRADLSPHCPPRLLRAPRCTPVASGSFGTRGRRRIASRIRPADDARDRAAHRRRAAFLAAARRGGGQIGRAHV